MLQDIYLLTQGNSSGTVTFEFTAVTTEDGTRASNSAEFTVEVEASGDGEGTIFPDSPSMTVNTNSALEDEELVLNITLSPGSNETTDVTLSLVIHNLHPDLSISGAYYNPYTDTWVMSESSLENGAVTISAPNDFAGNYSLEVEAIATNRNLESTSSGIETIILEFLPAGDGLEIEATAISEDPSASNLPEDQNFTLDIVFSEIDTDGSETQGDWVIIEAGGDWQTYWDFGSTDASYTFSYGPFVVDGVSGIEGINITLADLANLKIVPLENWHGDIPITIHGFTTEELDPSVIAWSSATFTFEVDAVADFANITVGTVTIPEYESTEIFNIFDAELIDTITENGGELISAKFTNLPDGSQFYLAGTQVQYGGFVADGVYSIPDITKLATGLELRGPEYVSGTFNVTLSVVTVESSNLDETTTEASFSLVIEPVASEFLILAKDIQVGSSGVEVLDLNVRLLDQNGTLEGETPPEVIELWIDVSNALTNDASGVWLRAGLGGHLEDNGDGTWIFIGTEDQANAIDVVNVAAPSKKVSFSVTGRTMDGSSVSEWSTDDFLVSFSALTTPGEIVHITAANYVGTDGNDYLSTESGVDQIVDLGDGTDIVTITEGNKTLIGGSGPDVYVWTTLDSSVDTIQNFDPNDGDQLNLSGLIATGSEFDNQSGDASDYVRLVSDVSGVFVQVAVLGDAGASTWESVVLLEGYEGETDLAALLGNILL